MSIGKKKETFLSGVCYYNIAYRNLSRVFARRAKIFFFGFSLTFVRENPRKKQALDRTLSAMFCGRHAGKETAVTYGAPSKPEENAGESRWTARRAIREKRR